MDLDEPIRFTVVGEEFTDISLVSPETRRAQKNGEETEAVRPPYVIKVMYFVVFSNDLIFMLVKAAIIEDGLGLTSWWG
jgi:hypothetical protein